MEIKLRPFNVPDEVRPILPPGRREDGIQFHPGFPLKDVPAEDLDRLCTEFRAEVFRKAGKPDPVPAAPTPNGGPNG